MPLLVGPPVEVVSEIGQYKTARKEQTPFGRKAAGIVLTGT